MVTFMRGLKCPTCGKCFMVYSVKERKKICKCDSAMTEVEVSDCPLCGEWIEKPKYDDHVSKCGR